MSLPDTKHRRLSSPRPARWLLVAALALAVAGCTVRPLYVDGASGLAGSPAVADRVANIAIAPAKDRVEQETRNRLVFLFGRGRGEPARPAYRMNLNVSAVTLGAAVVQVGSVAQEPTSSVVNVTARYSVTDTASGRVVARGSRTTSAAFDFPRQQFAALRAERDAEDRAAREVAELVSLSVAQALARAQ